MTRDTVDIYAWSIGTVTDDVSLDTLKFHHNALAHWTTATRWSLLHAILVEVYYRLFPQFSLKTSIIVVCWPLYRQTATGSWEIHCKKNDVNKTSIHAFPRKGVDCSWWVSGLHYTSRAIWSIHYITCISLTTRKERTLATREWVTPNTEGYEIIANVLKILKIDYNKRLYAPLHSKIASRPFYRLHHTAGLILILVRPDINC